MKIVGIDLETSGLSPEKDRIIELSAVLWDWDTKTPLRMISEIIDPSYDIEVNCFTVPQEIVEITGITDDMLRDYGEHEKDVLLRVAGFVGEGRGEYFMGHFCTEFDCLFFKAACERSRTEWMLDEKWLDTSVDIKYPPYIKTRNLRHLASEHNFLNPFSHRAVFDVLTMLNVASNYRIEDIIARSLEPTVYVQAQVSYAENQKAKDFQFRWNPEKKLWWKSMKQSDYEEERDKYEFKPLLFDPGLFKMEG